MLIVLKVGGLGPCGPLSSATYEQSQLHFCTAKIMAVLWSLTCAAVIL